MGKNHLKRLTVPASWDIPRKKTVFVTRPAPGPHRREFSIPLSTLLKENLPLFPTQKLLKHAMNNKHILIDNKTAHHPRASPGVMDTLSFPILNKYYRLTINKKGKLALIEIPQQESALKIVKIINKRVLEKDTLQLNLSDGRNLLTKNKTYATGDSLLLELPGQKIIEHYPLAPNSRIFVFKGKHTGQDGVIKEIKQDKVIFTHGTEEDETKKEFIFVTGRTTHAITIMKNQSQPSQDIPLLHHTSTTETPADEPTQEKEKEGRRGQHRKQTAQQHTQ